MIIPPGASSEHLIIEREDKKKRICRYDNIEYEFNILFNEPSRCWESNKAVDNNMTLLKVVKCRTGEELKRSLSFLFI
jgi:hypothetical protein